MAGQVGAGSDYRGLDEEQPNESHRNAASVKSSLGSASEKVSIDGIEESYDYPFLSQYESEDYSRFHNSPYRSGLSPEQREKQKQQQSEKKGMYIINERTGNNLTLSEMKEQEETYFSRQASTAEEREISGVPKNYILEQEEGLGEDYLDTPWVYPSLDKVKKYKQEELYLQGKGDIYSSSIRDAYDLGAGVPLFFYVTNTLFWTFILMSILTIPSFIFFGAGDR